MEPKRINSKITVSGQIAPEDLQTLKDQGFVAVINNRPDGEAPDQPAGSEIAQAARKAGLTYYAIPLGREGVSPDMVDKTRAALEASDGPVFAFCRSGTRSTTLWALSQAGQKDAGEIVSEAAGAGYDMSHLAGHLGQKQT